MLFCINGQLYLTTVRMLLSGARYTHFNSLYIAKQVSSVNYLMTKKGLLNINKIYITLQ